MRDFLRELGLSGVNSGASGAGWIEAPGGGELTSFSPVTGEPIAKVIQADENDYEAVVQAAQGSFLEWRMLPAPKRGEIVRQFGDRLRELKEPLGKLVSYEMGKSYQ